MYLLNGKEVDAFRFWTCLLGDVSAEYGEKTERGMNSAKLTLAGGFEIRRGRPNRKRRYQVIADDNDILSIITAEKGAVYACNR